MPARTLSLICLLIILRADAREARLSCQSACAELADRIRREPTKLAMAIEDALVAHEACTPELIATAIDTVAGEPLFVREIWDAATKVLPQRRAEIDMAVRRFSVPRAVVFKEPALMVRRAEAPGAGRTPPLEVRRAEAANDPASGPEPEVRRAVVPARTSSKGEPHVRRPRGKNAKR